MNQDCLLIRTALIATGLCLVNACSSQSGARDAASASTEPSTAAESPSAAPVDAGLGMPAATADTVPKISGHPLPDVQIREEFSFQPVVSDPSGRQLYFSVAGLPRWASFDASSGRLSGTPSDSDIGTYSNILITVSNGSASASLPVFAVSVNQISLGGATVSWMPPTENTDGSALVDLAGYAIHMGRAQNRLDRLIVLHDPTIERHVISGLSSGTWYFAVSAMNRKGAQSAQSAVISKKIS